MRSLCPITTPGSPEKLNPATLKGHSGVTVLQWSPTWYQTDGMAAPRCGSLARSGLPLAVSDPETTHEFDPMSFPAGPSRVGRDFNDDANPVSAAVYSDGVRGLSDAVGLAGETSPVEGSASGVVAAGFPAPCAVIVGCSP